MKFFKTPSVHVRFLVRHDMPEVLANEQTTPDPWDEDRVLGELRKPNQIGLVAELGGAVVGHLVYRLKPSVIEVVRLVVGERFRRKGVGTALYAKIVGKLGGRRQTLLLPVPETCDGMHRFLRSLGVPAVTVERNPGGADDYLFVAMCEECPVRYVDCGDQVP